MAKKKDDFLIGKECYACSRPAVSKEHAPPKGFYPPRKEVFQAPKGKDYRRNLISVPSCIEHNSDKASDDNFVQAAIAVFAAAYGDGLESAATHPFIRKLIRRIQNQPRLRKSLIENATPVRTAAGIVIALKPEAETIRRIIELTARALYYHDHGYLRRWPGDCQVHSPHFVMNDLSLPPGAHDIQDTIARFTHLNRINYEGFALKGPHPEVFAYQTLEIEERIVMRMTFYGSFHFLAISTPSGSPVPLGSGEP